MLSGRQREEVGALVEDNLNRAEQLWRSVGRELIVEAMDGVLKKAEVQPSKIPGHELVSDIEETVDEFIALMADMRGSSTRLVSAISEKKASVSQLQRVYFETSALLPALAKTIEYQGGRVTEYLGDGVLALFRVSTEEQDNTIYSAYWAATNCVSDTRQIVNDALNARYSLPPLKLGVGLAISKTIVTLVGLPGEKHAKVIGECVYRASKLSKGINEVYIDKYLKARWPKGKDGLLNFHPKNIREMEGFLVVTK